MGISLVNINNFTRKVIKKIGRIPSRLKQEVLHAYTQAVHHFVFIVTNKYWLIDYLPKYKSRPDSVLLVKLDLIGDFIIWLDAAKEFKTLYPEKQIVLYANAVWAPVADRLPYWDRVVSVDVTRLRGDALYRLRLLCKTHICGFDIAIQPTYSREYAVELIIRASNARQRIGHLGDLNNISSANKVITDSWYTQLVPLDAHQEVELNINAQLIRELGNKSFKSRTPSLTKFVDLPAKLLVKKPYCVIVPGASWGAKMWPFENFADLARELYLKRSLNIVLCGTPSEWEICDRIARLSGVNVVNFAGQTTLIEMIEVIRNARLLIANDSASIHIATATRTAAVCIVGGGHFGRFLPYQPEICEDHQVLPALSYSRMNCYGCRWRCHYPLAPSQAVPCISGVTVAQVWKDINQVLLSDG